ncbi:FAD/NAD(P)-binding oxidoreductase [Albimonas sp. CAU 1670]|uniref:FAD-dependent oxidoreductase n=1 Tax=Albimonas sp. CAU 1670 TaxID=3032599 RepID=UPI0023DB00C6|nr:FAD/NAD(P)-binding oxidoreductase [Albimonas sp. CAU 1670]MDF2231767.1 FAD/NAD(P)-binding oxidoreductase [Albimonas sp. CAU 1670]
MFAPAVFAPALAQARPKVVVIGGGPGGAIAARRMASLCDVTLVEPNPVYRSCFFSNLAIGGFLPFEALAHGYEGVRATGVTLAPLRALGVDPAARTVTLEGGVTLPYDRLVLAPGIAYRDEALPGWSPADEAVIPSAYVTGGDPRAIRDQVLAMPEGGTWCLVAPPDPSRCPPAPYERVSMVAHLLKTHNPSAKILIVDPKPRYASQALFEEGWQAHYTGMIDRLGPDFGADNIEIRPGEMQVIVDGAPEDVDACNVIPPQRAADICVAAGVTDDTGWAPVEATGMASTLQPDIHVVGDAASTGAIPKAASAAASEGEAAAAAILHALDLAPERAALYRSACWSSIAAQDAVAEEGAYAPGPDGRLAAVEHAISQTGEDPRTRRANWDDAFAWYADLTAEVFG